MILIEDGQGQEGWGGEKGLCVSANDLIVENRVLLVSHDWFSSNSTL